MGQDTGGQAVAEETVPQEVQELVCLLEVAEPAGMPEDQLTFR